jgi:hypothetical protein
MPTERPPLVGEVSANFCGYGVPNVQRDGSLRPYSRFLDRRLSYIYIYISYACFLIQASFWLAFFFPEDGGDIFLRNVGECQQTTQRYIISSAVRTPNSAKFWIFTSSFLSYYPLSDSRRRH